MSVDENVDYDPFEVEKYVVKNMQFFKRWTLNNITLNQLNGILLEQQMMPAQSNVSRVTYGQDVAVAESAEDDTSTQVLITGTIRDRST